jgi:hypothetical protein
MEQLEISYAPVAPVDPQIGDLERCLRGRGWTSAEDLAEQLRCDDRRVRKLASMSDQIVSGPGRPGYCHIADITREDYERCRAAMRSQTRKMIGRIVRWDRHFFRRLPVT